MLLLRLLLAVTAAAAVVVVVEADAHGGCVRNIEDFGAVAGDSSEATCVANALALTKALTNSSKCEVVVPEGKNFSVIGGILGKDLVDTIFTIDGNLLAEPLVDSWPFEASNKPTYQDVIVLRNCTGLHVRGGGLIDGGGIPWWNKEVLPQLFGHLKGNRPKLFRITESTDVLVEGISMHNSPSWTLLLEDVVRAEVSHVIVTVDRQKVRQIKTQWRQQQEQQQEQDSVDDEESSSSSSLLKKLAGLQPQDLNTDGIDCTGRDIYIHDSFIENDDDSIAVKPCSGTRCKLSNCTSNVLIERMVLTGFGASIGSVPPGVPPQCVQNVTFRDISMPKTGKGIYIKSNPSCETTPGSSAIIADILYENITITEPRWWPIWIGPQQQHEPGEKVGQACALTYPLSSHCPTQGCATFRNITLRDVNVYHPWLSAGVVMGNSTNPMQNVVFDRVVFHQESPFPYGKAQYKCENVQGVSIGSVPAPECMKQQQ